MAINPEILENMIRSKIADAVVKVEDLRADGQNFYSAQVISPSFAGKTRLECHRIVFAAIKGVDLESLSLRTAAK